MNTRGQRVFTETGPERRAPLSLPGVYGTILINGAMGRHRGQPAARGIGH